MHVIHARNICDALPVGIYYLARVGVREDSRAGPVIVAPGPVTTVYERPCERVLLSAVRDANPFFHVAEALWMIAGRRDAAFLNNFVRDFGERFAELDGTIHGAYGYRWRHALGFDQIDAVVERLRADPSSRQCVIQMWDANPTETEGGSNDLCGSWRDRPCNTHAYLRVRTKRGDLRAQELSQTMEKVLDFTVLCRSNDIIWGAYGANAVHFSVLQEYLAARIGVGVGTYYQVSNNFHAYEAELGRLCGRVEPPTELLDSLAYHLYDDRYSTQGLRPVPLVGDPETFDHEVRCLLELYEGLGEGPPDASAHTNVERLRNEFLSWTAWPMLMAHRNYRARNHAEAMRWTSYVAASDWGTAAQEWLARRAR